MPKHECQGTFPSITCSLEEIKDLIFMESFYYPGFLLYKHPNSQSLYIVDQHAADERCRLEYLMSKRLDGVKLSELQSWACKGAVKLTEETDREFRKGLLKRLIKCRDPGICAHGRPTIIKIKY
jgi:DNA mismatch repair ATPase MutL